jgi:hypothetical protein
VCHRGGRARAAPHLHHHRLAQVLARQRLDFGRHGGAEEQRLPVARHLLHDAVELRREAHVEHAVGFVEHQRLEVREVHVALLEMVEQTPGVATTTSTPLRSARSCGS